MFFVPIHHEATAILYKMSKQVNAPLHQHGLVQRAKPDLLKVLWSFTHSQLLSASHWMVSHKCRSYTSPQFTNFRIAAFTSSGTGLRCGQFFTLRLAATANVFRTHPHVLQVPSKCIGGWLKMWRGCALASLGKPA